MAITLQTPTASTWTLDQVIEQERELAEQEAFVATQPNERLIAFAEEYLCTSDLTFTPAPAVRYGERMWNVTLPASTGRRMRWGMELLLVHSDINDWLRTEQFTVRISRLRRILQPKYATVHGRIPVIGTLWVQLTRPDTGIVCLVNGRRDLDRYTKRIEN